MRKFARRLQDFSSAAAQVRQAVEAAPQQAAQLRESVLLAAGQLQQLRGEVQSSFAGVYVDSEDHLNQVVRELNDSSRIFADVGYEMVGVEIEFSPVQRVIIRLEKVEDVSLARIRSAMAGVREHRTILALLSSILKAEELAAKVTLPDLEYTGLVVHVGAAPAVRVCWSTLASTAGDTASVPPVIAATASSAVTTFAESGFFAPRSVTAAPSVPAAQVPAAAPAAASQRGATAAQLPSETSAFTPQAPAPAPGGASQHRDLLEKFKTSPRFSKYRSAFRK